MLKSIVNKYRSHSSYRRGVAELSRLTDRDLTDLGIHRSQIHEVARSGKSGL